MIRFVRKFVMGFAVPLVGLTLILESRRVSRLSILPFVMTLLIFLLGLALGLPFLTSLVAPFTSWILAHLPLKPTSETASVVAWVLPILIWPALAIALLFLLVVVTRLFVSPLFSLLAEKVLIVRGVIEPQRFQLFPWIRTNLRMLRFSIAKALLYIVIGFVLMVLSFLPGVGLVTAFAFMVLIAYDVTDYSLEALGLDLAQRFDFFKRHFPAFIGLGAVLGLVFLVPGLNFFLLPASVVGAAELVRKLR